MNCRELVDFLMGYLEGELPDAQRTEFESHLAECPPCLVYIETYQEAIRLGKELCRDEAECPPEDVPEELIQAILAARSR